MILTGPFDHSMTNFIRYPGTPHLRGSRLQDGDNDLAQVELADVTGCALVWEEPDA
jgi:hypothetical protein